MPVSAAGSADVDVVAGGMTLADCAVFENERTVGNHLRSGAFGASAQPLGRRRRREP